MNEQEIRDSIRLILFGMFGAKDVVETEKHYTDEQKEQRMQDYYKVYRKWRDYLDALLNEIKGVKND